MRNAFGCVRSNFVRVPREEAFDMLQAMNTGHEGSMTTIHANSRDAQKRLEQMITWLE